MKKLGEEDEAISRAADWRALLQDGVLAGDSAPLCTGDSCGVRGVGGGRGGGFTAASAGYELL